MHIPWPCHVYVWLLSSVCISDPFLLLTDVESIREGDVVFVSAGDPFMKPRGNSSHASCHVMLCCVVLYVWFSLLLATNLACILAAVFSLPSLVNMYAVQVIHHLSMHM